MSTHMSTYTRTGTLAGMTMPTARARPLREPDHPTRSRTVHGSSRVAIRRARCRSRASQCARLHGAPAGLPRGPRGPSRADVRDPAPGASGSGHLPAGSPADLNRAVGHAGLDQTNDMPADRPRRRPGCDARWRGSRFATSRESPPETPRSGRPRHPRSGSAHSAPDHPWTRTRGHSHRRHPSRHACCTTPS